MAKKTDTPTFAEFWAQYPVHKDRKRAEQAWNRLTTSDCRAALAAVPAYVADCQQNGIDRYKYAQGWLNGRRWEDETTLPLPSEGRGVPCGQTATEKEHSRAAQTDFKSGCTEYKDLQSAHRIANAHTPSGRIANPPERPELPAPLDGMDKW